MAGIAFSGLQNYVKLHIGSSVYYNEDMHSSGKGIMNLEESIVRPPKGRTEALWILDTCGSRDSRPLKNLTFRPSKCRTEALLILWVEGLMTLGYPSLVNGFTKIFFQASNMTKICTSEALYYSARNLMTLEETHCQSSKRPNRGFVNGRYLWVEGLRPLKNLIFRPPKCQTEALLILWVEGLMPLEESFRQRNK
jgi:hypothetical protein